MAIYEKRQKRISQLITDNDITSADIFARLKDGLNRKTSIDHLLDLISSIYGLSARVYVDRSEMVADDIQIGEIGIVQGDRFAVYSIGVIAAGNGDVTLASGYVATQIGKIQPNNFQTYAELEGFDTTVIKDNERFSVVGTPSTLGIRREGTFVYSVAHGLSSNSNDIFVLSADWYAKALTANNIPLTIDGVDTNVSSYLNSLNPESVAAMISDASILPGYIFRTQGFYAGSSFGAAMYECKTSAQAATDGDVIDGYANHTLTNGHVVILQTTGAVNTAEYGAPCDGSASASIYIQKAIYDGITTGRGTVSPEGALHSVDTQILVVNQPTFGDKATVDFQGATFKLASDFGLFTSAYDSGSGVLVTNVGTAYNTHHTFGVSFGGFVVKSNVGTVTSTHVEFQDWHQDTEIKDIYSKVCVQVLHSINNFYCKFRRISTLTPTITTGDRFLFTGPHNLNVFEELQGTNASSAYRFAGALTAAVIRSCSFEGITIGATFDSTVYDLKLENNYFEHITDTYLVFNAPVEACVLSNNYFNFVGEPAAFLIDYLAGPNNNIVIEKTNSFVAITGDSQLFKAIDTTLGYNLLTLERPPMFAFDIDDYYVDQTDIPSGAIVEQQVESSGLKTNIVNKYATGDYAGRYTDGHDRENGFEWLDLSSSTLALRTKIIPSTTNHLYVNLRVNTGSSSFVKGVFVGTVFYEYTATTVTVSTALTLTTVDGFYQINGTYGGTIVYVRGEVRLM